MLADASKGKIDIIITKSISRFNRNFFDLLSYLNSFREYSVRIIFEEENIDTISKDFELGLKMRTMLAEEEVRNISNHVKRAIEMKAENGIASCQMVCYGYDYHPEDKSLTINEYEADIVRNILEYETVQINELSFLNSHIYKEYILVFFKNLSRLLCTFYVEVRICK